MPSTMTLPTTSRVWIYQSSPAFNDQDAAAIQEKISAFTTEWSSHNKQLYATGEVLHNRFIVLMVDESKDSASGCSIDKSTYFLQGLEKEYGVDLFDRMIFTYEKDGKINAVHKEEFSELYKAGVINDDTIVFNNLVRSKEEFDKNWKIRLGDSWHKNLI